MGAIKCRMNLFIVKKAISFYRGVRASMICEVTIRKANIEDSNFIRLAATRLDKKFTKLQNT
jgi:hypothetical protein